MLVISLLCFTHGLWAAPGPTPLPIPFSEDFESGQWNVNFGTNHYPTGIVEVTKYYDPLGIFHLATHSVANNKKAYNEIDMHLDMTGATRDIFFRFFAKKLNQQIQPSVELWFSDDGGNHFTKLINPLQSSRFVTIYNWQHNWKIYTVNMTDLIRPYGLTFTHHCVIRMAVKTLYQASRGGIAFDNISVKEEQVIVTGELPERTLYYDLGELEFPDILDCGRIDCPPPFWDEGILREDFWSIYPGYNGMAYLEPGEKGYHLHLSSMPNEDGYAVSAAALRFDASPWAATDPDIDPAHVLKFSWKSEAESLTPYDVVYFSDNGGETYAKVFDFSENPYELGEWQETTMNLSKLTSSHGLKFSDRFVVVFQHFSSAKEGSLGYGIGHVLVGATDPDIDPDHPKSYSYPNPFYTETNIRFKLAQESEVRLKILDSQGKIINTITEKNLPVGTHTLLWNGKDSVGKRVQPGIYYYLLETPEGIETKRIWLEK